MGNINELYQKVAADAALQAKFATITKEAEQTTREAIEERLIAFAKEAGFDVSIEEAKTYFEEQAKSQNAGGELSEHELDMVAGGKSSDGGGYIVGSVLTVGLFCAAASAQAELEHALDARYMECSQYFE